MHIRKHRKKWQGIVLCKGHVVIQSFESKSDARSWGEKTSSELRNGSYQNSDKLISMTLKDLLAHVGWIVTQTHLDNHSK